MVGKNLISVKVFNLCALGNVTILHGLYLNIQTNNHLPPCKDLTKTQSMIWITCHQWGGLTWLHNVTWGYTIWDEGWSKMAQVLSTDARKLTRCLLCNTEIAGKNRLIECQERSWRFWSSIKMYLIKMLRFLMDYIPYSEQLASLITEQFASYDVFWGCLT